MWLYVRRDSINSFDQSIFSFSVQQLGLMLMLMLITLFALHAGSLLRVNVFFKGGYCFYLNAIFDCVITSLKLSIEINSDLFTKLFLKSIHKSTIVLFYAILCVR